MKNIKLNEQELIQVISETVNKLLSELDWKTYNSAASKEKDPLRRTKFADMRNDKFNDEFGYKNGDNSEISMKSGYKDTPTLRFSQNFKNGDYESYTLPHELKGHDMYSHIQGHKDGFNNSHSYADRPSTDDNKTARKLAKAHDEFNASRKGDYKYVKGRGYVNTSKSDIENADGKPNTNGTKNQRWHDFLKKNN